MSSKVAALLAAEAALARNDRAAALGMLLEAWRTWRQPRIADLIDLVSDELTATTKPIKGKSVSARMAVWHALEQQRDPAMLGRLLATEWPGTWQAALPMLEPLLTWPDDPRIAMAFARLVDETRYVTWTAAAFYKPLFARLDELHDVRVLPLLRAQLEKHKPYYYRRDMRALDERAVEVLEQVFPDGPGPLPPEVEAALRVLELRYAAELRGAGAKAKGEAEFIAAILADPENLALRAVYGDWLGERGDPRGELITLQLARAAGPVTEAAESRERKLLELHGRQWAGAIENWFVPDGRRFEGGFFAGGRLRSVRDSSYDGMLQDPAWALVRLLEPGDWSTEDHLLALLDRPELRALRAIHGVTELNAATIAAGPPRALTELSWTDRYDSPTIGRDHALATCAALPDLRILGMSIGDARRLRAWFAEAPVVERIERLVISVKDNLTELLESLATRSGTLREVEIVVPDRGALTDAAGWHFRLRRDVAPGPFVSLSARHRVGKTTRRWNFVSDLQRPLAAVPADWLRVLHVDAGRKLTLNAADRRLLGAAVARFTRLEEVTVPWEVPPLRGPAPPSGLRLSLTLRGEGLLDPTSIERVWRLVVDELGQVYDGFEVGYNSTLRALGDRPFERAVKWAANVRTNRLELLRDGHPEKLVLTRGRRSNDDELTALELALGERTLEELVAWLVRFLDIAAFTSGQCELAQVDRQRELFEDWEYQPRPGGGWLLVFGPRYLPVLPRDQVARLAARPGLAGLFVVPTPRNLVVGVARTPGEVTPARLRLVASELRAIIDRQVTERLGYDLAERATALLGPAATALGLTARPDPHRTWTLNFVKAGPPEWQLAVELSDVLGAPTVDIVLRSQSPDTGGYHAHPLLRDTPAATRSEIDTALIEAAKAAREQAPAWFADPSTRRRR